MFRTGEIGERGAASTGIATCLVGTDIGPTYVGEGSVKPEPSMGTGPPVSEDSGSTFSTLLVGTGASHVRNIAARNVNKIKPTTNNTIKKPLSLLYLPRAKT